MSTPLYQHGNFAETIGYRLTAWRQDEAEISFEADDRHMNRSGLLHGGVLATVIDAACGFAGCYQPPPDPGRRALTLSLTTQYLAAVAAGTRLTATATRTGGGRTIFFSNCEVRDAEGRLIATGSGTFKYRS